MDSARAYEVHAHDFLRGRDTSPIGTRIVEEWSRALPRSASVIGLACGGGYPITRVLNTAGLQLWAVDSSPTLVTTFRSRFPTIPIQCARVQACDFFERKFEGAIAIGLLFLLSEGSPGCSSFPLSEILVPRGRFLFTAPIEIGTWKDMNTEIECTSLGRDDYEGLLTNAGFRVVATYTDKGDNNYYDVEKVR